MKTSIILFLSLFISLSSFAQDCRPSLYQMGEEKLCFSSKLKSYLTQSCTDDKCQALELVEKSKTFNRDSLPKGDSSHPGAKTCEALGGKVSVVTSEKTQDKICLCMAEDKSGVSCSRLGLR